jgi:hypothetical protein
MRYTQAEKLEIIRLVEGSDLPVKTTLKQLQVSRTDHSLGKSAATVINPSGAAEYFLPATAQVSR